MGNGNMGIWEYGIWDINEEQLKEEDFFFFFSITIDV